MRWTAHITIYTADGDVEDMRLIVNDTDLTFSGENVARYHMMASAAGLWQCQNPDLLIEAIEIIAITHSDHGIATLQ